MSMENVERQRPADIKDEGEEDEASAASSALLEDAQFDMSRRHRHPVQTFPLPRPQPWSRVGNGRVLVNQRH